MLYTTLNKRAILNLFISFSIFVSGFVIIFLNSKTVSYGVIYGINLTVNLLIPSLFLPTLLTSFLADSGLIEFLGQKINKFTTKLLKLSGIGFFVFVLSLISGYPVGAVMINRFEKERVITISEAKRLLLFSINGGPAFIYIGIGIGMLNNKTLGIYLLTAHILSAIITAIISGILFSTDFYDEKSAQIKTESVALSFVSSVYSTCKSMMIIAASTVIFSAMNSVISEVMPQSIVKTIALSAFEVTNACMNFAKSNNIAAISACLGFSGLSVIMQVFFVREGKGRLLEILLFRIVNGAVSYIIMSALLKLFPVTASVFAGNDANRFVLSSENCALSVLLIIFSVIFIFSIHQRKNKKIIDFLR